MLLPMVASRGSSRQDSSRDALNGLFKGYYSIGITIGVEGLGLQAWGVRRPLWVLPRAA